MGSPWHKQNHSHPAPEKPSFQSPSKHQFCAPQFLSEHHFCVLSGVHVSCECLGGLCVWCWGGHPSWPVCPKSWGRQRPHDPTRQYSSLNPLPSQNRVPQLAPTLLCLERLPGTKGFHFALWFLFNVYTLFLPAAPAQPGWGSALQPDRGAPGPVPPPLFGM